MEGFCRSPEQEDLPTVARLILPKTAFKDVKSFLRLEEGKLRALEELFGTPASIATRRPEFIREVAKQLHLDIPTTDSVVLVCQFLLTVVEEGNPPEEILNDLREFVAQHASPEEKDVVAAPEQKRQALISLLTPKPGRTRALKVEYLAHGPHPTVDSFRTVCELRPVFECPEGRQTIVGYVPTILLEVKVSDMEGQGKTVLLYLTAEMLKSLKEVVTRTEEKLEAIRAKFDKELLHD
jgi:hypothetical protein